jgi:NADH:ubiquinone oxidoreductase subunit 6 (subunit J)
MQTIVYVLIGAIVVTILVITLLILEKKTYRYLFRIREQTNSGIKIIKETLAKVKRDDRGVEYLYIRNPINKKYNIAPLPPPEAIDYNPSRKMLVVEAWFTSEDGYVYIQDKGRHTGFEPLTTKQRSMLVSQIITAEQRKKKNWTEHLPLIVSMTALVVIIAVILLFWGEAVKPMMAYSDKMDGLLTRIDSIESKYIIYQQGGQVPTSTVIPPP